MKKEFAKLHERYTELFKTHMDYIERTKIIMGTGDRLEVQGRQRLPPLAFSQLNRYDYIACVLFILLRINYYHILITIQF